MIRDYDKEDVNIINVLGRDLKSNYLFSLTNVGKCLVYENDDEILGFITFDMYDDRAEILDITVHINHRNNGIGCELINKVLEICKNNGCKSITLEVRHNNASAVALYKKCGFKTISTRKRYYENGTVDAYLMFREL